MTRAGSDMVVVIATMRDPAEEVPETVDSLFKTSTTYPLHFTVHNTPERNLGVVGSYEQAYRQTTASILFYCHDDVMFHETGWDARLLREFDDPSVAVVACGGALKHGADDLYKRPYHYQQLIRSSYRSNVDDAEVHGERFAGACDVATIDGYAFAVRRKLLDRCGGWPVGTPIGYIGYDQWIVCMAHRYGYRARCVGLRVHHLGGRTFVKMNLTEDQIQYHAAHRYLYENFRDVLPWECRR